MIHVISLGAGVQSSTMALMAAHGEIEPIPRCAIFADTGWEPKRVYEWLDWLEKRLPFPVVRVGQPTIRRDTIAGCTPYGRTTLPFFTKEKVKIRYEIDDFGEDYREERIETREGMALRKCTSEYKIKPIEQYIRREILGLKPRQKAPRELTVIQWRGISTDEASRMKPSEHKWMGVRYPLAMELGMSRNSCLRWMQFHAYPEPPRSACIGCPFHNNAEWRDMKLNRTDEFADAVDFDSHTRKAGGMRSESFLHRSCQPLSDVNFSNDIDRGQGLLSDWVGECEGMCGL